MGVGEGEKTLKKIIFPLTFASIGLQWSCRTKLVKYNFGFVNQWEARSYQNKKDDNNKARQQKTIFLWKRLIEAGKKGRDYHERFKDNVVSVIPAVGCPDCRLPE